MQLSFSEFYSDHEPGSVTPGHVHQGKCSWEYQEHCKNDICHKESVDLDVAL